MERRGASGSRTGLGGGVAVLVVAAALLLAACGGAGGGAGMGSGTSTQSSRAKATDSITISNFMFSPMAASVAPGATINVTNRDSVTHTLSATGGHSTPVR